MLLLCCGKQKKKKERRRRRTLLLISLMMSFKVGLSGIAMIFLIGTVKKGFSIIPLKPAYGNEELDGVYEKKKHGFFGHFVLVLFLFNIKMLISFKQLNF